MNFDEVFMNMKKTPAFSEFIHWKELEDRILVMNEEVDEFMVENYIMPIIKWNKEDEGKDYTERKPITIYLNSPGGDVFTGLVLAEVIKKSKTPVKIIVLSMAASMASVILVAAHVRLAYKHSNILIHDGTQFLAGTGGKVRDTMKFYEKKNTQVKNFIISNTKITSDLYESKEHNEWWMDANEALELGLIDRIIGEE